MHVEQDARAPAGFDPGLLAVLPQMVWVADAGGRITYVSPSWFAYTGHDAAATDADRWQLVHPEDRTSAEKAWNEALAKGQAYDIEYRLRGTDGVYRWQLVRSQPVRDGGGIVRQWVVTCTDIENSKRNERLLRDQATILRMIATASPQKAVLTAIVGMIEHQSDTLLASILLREGSHLHLGAAPSLPDAYNAAVEGLPIGPDSGSCGTAAFRAETVAVSDIAVDPLWQRFAAFALSFGLRACWSKPIMGRNGEVLGTVAIYRRQVGSPAPSDMALIDTAIHLTALVLERESDARDRAALVADMRNSLHVREDFLHLASHELRTPVTSMRLQLDTLRRRLSQRDSQVGVDWIEAKLKATTNQLQRLETLVREILTASRILAGQTGVRLSRVDLAKVVAPVAAHLQGQAEAQGCRLSVRIPSGIVGPWDAEGLGEIVTRLLENALKYGQGKPIHLWTASGDRQVKLFIQDQGIGIADEDQRRIFGRFARLSSVRHAGGFGLGLWIADELARAVGGKLDVYSRLGAGATFVLTLPMAAGAAGLIPATATDRDAAA